MSLGRPVVVARSGGCAAWATQRRGLGRRGPHTAPRSAPTRAPRPSPGKGKTRPREDSTGAPRRPPAARETAAGLPGAGGGAAGRGRRGGGAAGSRRGPPAARKVTARRPRRRGRPSPARAASLISRSCGWARGVEGARRPWGPPHPHRRTRPTPPARALLLPAPPPPGSQRLQPPMPGGESRLAGGRRLSPATDSAAVAGAEKWSAATRGKRHFLPVNWIASYLRVADSLLLSLRCSPGSAAAAAAASNRLLPPLPFRSQPGRSSSSPLQNGAKRYSAAAPIEPPRTAPGGRQSAAWVRSAPCRPDSLALARSRARARALAGPSAQLPSAPPRARARARLRSAPPRPSRAHAATRARRRCSCGGGETGSCQCFLASLTFAENHINCYISLALQIKVGNFLKQWNWVLMLCEVNKIGVYFAPYLGTLT